MMYSSKSGQGKHILGRRTKRSIEVGISLLLIPLLLLSIGLTALPVRAADTYDFSAYENSITDDELVESLSKEYVFKDESFKASATVSATLLEDLSFNNVVELEYQIRARSQYGNSVILGNYSGSVGPLLDLKSGTRLSYTLLDTPLVFPGTAAAGNYTIELEIIGIKPDFVWQTVQDNVDEGDLTMDLGSINYLGIERPDIKISLTSPAEVNAGASFPVEIGVTYPSGISQIKLSLSYQETGGTPVVSEVSMGGPSTQTVYLTAPVYDGELKLTSSVASYFVMGTYITPTVETPVSTITLVKLPSPTMSLIVTNPVAAGVPVNFKLKITNPNTSSISMGVYLLPEWDVPSWAGADMSWFFADVQTVSLTAGEVKEVSLSVSPITESGKTYSLKAQFTQYQLQGETVKPSTPVVAEAVVTTANHPVGQLNLSRASVYPYEGFNVDALIFNPGASALSASYQIRVSNASKVEDLFGTSFDVWKSDTSNIAAGSSAPLSFAGPTANQEQKYMGFELMVNGESLARATLYVKAVAPPTIKVVPSTYTASAGQTVSLGIELQNQMGIAAGLNLQILQRIWNGSGWVETTIGTETKTLSAKGKGTAAATVITPSDPVIIEYGARISQITLSSTNFTVDKSTWVRVELQQLVLPQITLALNPGTVTVGSSMEIKATVYNQSDKDIIVPLSIYIKPPSSYRNLLEKQDVSVPAGGSTSFSKYLKVEEAWQSLGSMEVILTASEVTLGGAVIPLATPIEVKKSITILNLQLKASLKTEVASYQLSYDVVNNYLVMDSVQMTATIVITNVGGWESCPEMTLSLLVPASTGVTLMEGWQAVTIETKALIAGGALSTTASIAISGPTAANLSNVNFIARVTAGGVVYDFDLGMFRVNQGSWILDENARMVNIATGSRFASPNWDSDGDGHSDYAEMIERNTKPLDATDPGTISAAEKAQAVKELEAEVNAFVFRAEQFIDIAANGGSLIPSGNAAWNRIKDQGKSAQDSLVLLRNLTLDPYAALTAKVNGLVDQINSLETTVKEKYGDSSTPRQIRDLAIQTILGMGSAESNADPDNDGLPTAVELGLGYDPNKWDSQQAGISDKDYLAGTVAGEANTQDKVLLGSYVALGQMGRIIEDITGSLPEGVSMTEADQQALLEEAQQALRDAAWEYINAFFI